MRKTLAIATMLAVVPFAAQAKSTISDADMGRVTGQAGVSIDMDLRMDLHADTIAWGNSDGTNTSWIGMKGFDVANLTVKLRPDLLTNVVNAEVGKLQTAGALAAANAALAASPTDPGLIAAQATALANDVAAAGAVTAARAAVHPVTIDVATVGSAPEGNKAAGTTYVRFGLGSLQVAMDKMEFGVALGKGATGGAPTAATLGQELGTFHLGKMEMNLNGASKVDIYSTQASGAAGTGSGVVFDVDVLVDSFKAASMSWGNSGGSVVGTSATGGAAAATTAGYVGFSNLNVDGIKITGPVSIQVATVGTSDADINSARLAVANAVAAGDQPGKAAAVSRLYYALYNSVGSGAAMGSSFVHFGLGSGNSAAGSAFNADGSLKGGAFGFQMASLTADVKVGNNADLSSTGTGNSAGTYGTFGMSNFKVGMNGWVNIGTH